VVKKVQLQKTWRDPRTSISKNRGGKNARLPFPEDGDQNTQPVVKGEENKVADALSCDDDRTNDELTLVIINLFPPHRFPLISKNSTVSQRNNLISYSVAVQIAHERAVERGTHEKQTRLWERWKKYAKSIGIEDDFYLKIFSQEEHHVLIGTFAIAVSDARISRSPHEKLVANTVQDIVPSSMYV
jgi:hypothetical protein